jgi:septal ring factor EnvC (AmiA/AmiB activator)
MELAKEQHLREMLEGEKEKGALKQDITDKEDSMMKLSEELWSTHEEVARLTSVRGELEDAISLLRQDVGEKEAALASLKEDKRGGRPGRDHQTPAAGYGAQGISTDVAARGGGAFDKREGRP